MVRDRLIFVLAAILLVTLVSCRKTEAGETKAFERNKKQVTELKALYPKFGHLLDEELKTAEKHFESAKAIGDEKDRIKRMADINKRLSGGFVSDLAAVDRQEKELRQKLTRVTTEVVDRRHRAAVENAQSEVERTMKDVRRVLDRGARDTTGASAVLRKVRGDIEAADRNLDRVLKAAGVKSKAKDKAKGSDSAPASMDPPTWKCEYCGNTNEGKHLKCPSCGASK